MEYSWQFFRAGGIDQVAIRSANDIAHLGELDQKLWVALACPTRGIEIDPRTLDLIDTDNDGRIRPPELIAACSWACEQLRDPDELMQGGDTLALASIDDGGAFGPSLADEARRILILLGKPEEITTISLDDVVDRSKLIAAMRFNGDGVITTKIPEDDTLRLVVQHIIDTQGSIKDLGGDDGIDRTKADAFFTQATALRDWHALVAGDATVLPLGERTGAASDALSAVREKIDDFFARCRLAAYDIRSLEELNPSQERYQEIAAQALSLTSPAIAELPLAAIESGPTLSLLGSAVNPAWAHALSAFKEHAYTPLFGEASQTLTETDWAALQASLEPYRQWLLTRPQTSLDALSIDEVAQIADSDAQAAINGLIDEDLSVEPQNARIVDLEKLLRYKRDLLRLLNNFVSFKDFYRREGATFEAGTLYLDGRSCDLTIQVADAGKHASLAGLAKACLAYCECRRAGEKMTIVAAFTAGDTDFLFVGRNGIFYDRNGRDWDATIIKMIDNPTNVRQAFLSPYKKFIRAIEEQVAKRAAASDASTQSGLGSVAGGLVAAGTPASGTAASGTAPAPANKGPSKIDVGTVAALGVALGSISAVLVGIFGKFVDLGWWIPIALIGIMFAISGPSMLIAWLKLRERSLSPILDASGWAINGHMKVNVRLGRLLSQMAHIPLNARPLRDPYADRNGARYTASAAIAVLIIVAAIWRFGLANAWLPAQVHYSAVAASVKQAVSH